MSRNSLLAGAAAILLSAALAYAQTGSPKTVTQMNTEVNTLFPDNTTGLITPFDIRQVLLDNVASSGNLNTPDLTLSGGVNVVSFSLGVLATGTTAIDCGKGPLQFFTNGGASTIAAPSLDGSCMVLSTNNANAGALTFSGFSVGNNTGDTLDTVNAHSFSIFIWRINGISGYRVAGHQ